MQFACSLQKNNGRLTTLQLLGMARGIASGMNYLSGRNFIHRVSLFFITDVNLLVISKTVERKEVYACFTRSRRERPISCVSAAQLGLSYCAISSFETSMSHFTYTNTK